jgi:type II secretory pathway pseudopilin PulG
MNRNCARGGSSLLPSALCPHPSCRAFTLIEMLTTVAVLIIVLGLMVSLARYVRDRSAQQLTRQTLRNLETLMSEYADHNAGHLPAVDPILPPEAGAAVLAPRLPTTVPAVPIAIDEAALAEAARRNNLQYVAALKRDYLKRHAKLPLQAPHETADVSTHASPGGGGSGASGSPDVFDPFEQSQIPVSIYDHRTLRDAWGSPIVFMPNQHQLIGLAPSRAGQDQYFFFSAGPDRKYLTRDDNLYSYEATGR